MEDYALLRKGAKNNMFWKDYWLLILIFILVISFSGFMVFKETKLNTFLTEEALKGNSSAIKFLYKYEKKKICKNICHA